MVKKKRIHTISRKNTGKKYVIYWMSRDQRVQDNWGLLLAQEIAQKTGGEFAVVFCLSLKFLDATFRQYDFMLKGLKEVSSSLKSKNIPFYLLPGDPVKSISEFTENKNIGTIVTDFDPLRIKQKWQKDIAGSLNIDLLEVDSHNIIPARYVSDKREFGAYTIRPKIHKKLEEFLEEFPEIKKQKPSEHFKTEAIDWSDIYSRLKINRNVKPVEWIQPGESAAHLIFEKFRKQKLRHYADQRNDPTRDALSNLSPYFHFGQISTQRLALELLKKEERHAGIDSFLEEMIVRKELSDNYCLYNKEYDSLENLPDWSSKTLNDHKNDKRDHLYSLEDFEEARTHEELWNAAQNQMKFTGKMHGYMRMYWAKKILEWTKDPETAMKYAVYLNDKYELDGRDPNGYVGCAWAIGGVHDRAWTERPVFGKIRYMNFNGAKRKFDVNSYISEWNSPKLF